MINMAYHSPFELYHWWVTTFAGNISIFLAIALIGMTSLAALFRMPVLVIGMMFSLFIIMLSTYFQNFYIIVAVIGGLVVGWILIRLLSR